jgi:colicin import membrane protein
MVDGKVVFTLDKDVPGKNAQQIYDIVYQVLERMTTGENQFKESQISLVNKAEHVIAARYREWLVFKNSFLSLDRTVFDYTIIANCSDGHLNLTLSRIFYSYEVDREGGGLETKAEEWITDEYALNKSKTKLSKYSGKFRRKTIDRKDEIFEIINNALDK